MDISAQEPNKENGVAVSDGVSELRALCDNGFGGDMSAAALVLGRDEELLTDMLNGNTEVDEDLIMKIHGLAEERGIDLGNNSGSDGLSNTGSMSQK